MKLRVELEIDAGDDMSYGEFLSVLWPATHRFATAMRPKIGETRLIGAKAILPRDPSLAAAIEHAITVEGVQ